MKKGMVDEAVILIRHLTATDPTFSASCHSYAHKMGWEIYDLYKTTGKIDIGGDISFCNWGLVHGFLEQSVARGAETKKAVQDFCKKVVVTGNVSIRGMIANCFHGVGHGVVNNHDPRVLGKPEEFVKPALITCGAVSENDIQRKMCAYGVFMGVFDFMATGQYQLSVDKNDPLGICEQQDEIDKSACYFQSYPVISVIAGHSFLKLKTIVSTIGNPVYAHQALQSTVSTKIFSNLNTNEIIEGCQSLGLDYSVWCMRGIALTYMGDDKYGQEYMNAFSFCNNLLMTISEKLGCEDVILTEAKSKYPQPKFASICALYDKDGRFQVCQR
ncbi:hypothetical protein HY024_03920 [Candidatus Curtissbacteria bacterium]|nr:hypothetical protein [Candidatus Curtissbacteria bacterium]